MVALKLRTSASFRAVAKSSHILREYWDIPLQPVAPNTVMEWVRKLGYYALTKPKPAADDWVILLDHSAQLGAEKLFVILGIRESLLDFSRPLAYTDLTPLWISASGQWDGDFIREVLERLQARLGRLKYAVGDYGSDIRKGLRLAGVTHIHDVTHRIALSLKRLYADDPTYQDVSQRLARIRQQFGQTVAAHLLPPTQRTKSRYHNLRPIAAYGQHILTYLERFPTPPPGHEAFHEAIIWVREKRTFFDEMREVTTVVCDIERLVKHHGLSSLTLERCCHCLSQVSTTKGFQFKFDILVYFHLTLTLPHMRESLLCTSDILESAFGKYKTYLSGNPMAGITDLALCIAAFTCSLTPQEILEACEQTRKQDVARWGRLYLCPTLLKRRQQAFSNTAQNAEKHEDEVPQNTGSPSSQKSFEEQGVLAWMQESTR
jgi:hypothetical protein